MYSPAVAWLRHAVSVRVSIPEVMEMLADVYKCHECKQRCPYISDLISALV